jgi:hypothetical protein
MSSDVTAPVPPGRLGQPVPTDDAMVYLTQLRRWLDGRRAELDRIDRAARSGAAGDELTADLTLALAVWQEISDRYDQLVSTWDSGRADTTAREHLSRLIWGRLAGATAGTVDPGLAVSLVEALTLSDALALRLLGRLALDPLAGVGERLAVVRAAVERCRDQADDRRTGSADAAAAVQRLRVRVDDLTAKAGRGADVTGPLALVETDVARTERDLIVAAARRRDLLRDRERAARRLRALASMEEDVRAVAARCTEKIADAPDPGVPELSALGPVPDAEADVDAYLVRLDDLERALTRAAAAYQAPLDERAELRGRLRGFQAKARAELRDQDPAVMAAWDPAYKILWTAPCDLGAARAAVLRYQRAVRGDSLPGIHPEPPEPA